MVLKLNRLYKLLPLLFFATFTIYTEAQTVTSQIHNLLKNYTDKKKFSGSVLVAKNGQIIFKRGYGFSDFENRIKNTIHTKFSIGSTTKSFTACAIMQEVEKGNLDLNTPISEYIPQLKKRTRATYLTSAFEE